MRLLELRGLERPAEAAKDRRLVESIAAALPRCAAEPVKLSRNLVGHRNTARRATGLRSAELAQHVVLADPDPAGDPVHVAPSKRHQLALPPTGHRGRGINRTVGL